MLLVGGGVGGAQLEPGDGVVQARVLGQTKGPKIRIGKYKKRTGYRRHTGFRASLTQIEIASIGGAAKVTRSTAKPKAETAPQKAPEKAPKATEAPAAADAGAGDLPKGYADMTIADLKAAIPRWSASELAAALAYEQEHGKRKGALAALESASGKEGDS